MPYDPMLVKPMREEAVALGARELLTPADVDAFVAGPGTAVLLVNSVCGCAAGGARPGLALALRGGLKADRVGTVFAGQDVEATRRAREHFDGAPPSSPAIAVFKDGKLKKLIQRWEIEGRLAPQIAEAVTAAHDAAVRG
ncbi:MAG TPA: BrxA/BrxB family bacilliredoxin [Planctomycetota bacterium]|nr:BrxA/BrxB family bacilliredoxin [Planctomycetota bacterium]